MKIRFLLDENLSPRFKIALLRFNPAIDVLRIGEPGAPPLETLDPDILKYLEISQRALVTFNRTSMPAHLEDHWASGGHTWGVFWIRSRRIPINLLTRELFLIWEASEAEEWVDRLNWIPF
jgi:hypothetical protein